MNKPRNKTNKSFYTPIIKRLVFVSGVIIFSAPNACCNNIESSVESLIPEQRITVDSVGLTAQDFFKAYISKSVDERKNAELYLLGVMDATEGKSWCDYRTYKTITLRERIFVGFKKLEENQLSERAASIIENILSRRYPCGSVK